MHKTYVNKSCWIFFNSHRRRRIKEYTYMYAFEKRYTIIRMPIIWCTGTVNNLANQSFAMVGTLFTLSLKKVVRSVFNNIR